MREECLANFFDGGELGCLIAHNTTFADVLPASLKLRFYQHHDFAAPALVWKTS